MNNFLKIVGTIAKDLAVNAAKDYVIARAKSAGKRHGDGKTTKKGS